MFKTYIVVSENMKQMQKHPYENEKWAAHWSSGQLSGQALPTIYVNSL